MLTQKSVNKAARLVADGRVTRLPGIGGGCRLWLVFGDTDDYTVTTRGAKARCSCKRGRHGKACTHALAALYAARNGVERK
jgi:predicted nucleic acid-binding Zn finger protein